MRPRGKIVGIENVPRKILYNVGHFKVSLDLPFNLKFQNMKYKQLEIQIFACFHVFGNIFAYISRPMRPRRKIVRVKNVSCKISYKVGHSRVSLGPPISHHKIEIYIHYISFEYWLLSRYLINDSAARWGLRLTRK